MKFLIEVELFATKNIGFGFVACEDKEACEGVASVAEDSADDLENGCDSCG